MELRIVGGHPALDLANTVAPRPAVEVDFLPDPAALLAWARRINLIDAAESDRIELAWSPRAADEAFADVLALRALIDPVLACDQLDALTSRWAAAIARSILVPASADATPPAERRVTLPTGAGATPSAGRGLTLPTGAGATLPADTGVTLPTGAGATLPAGRGVTLPTGAGAGAGATLVVGTDPAWMIGDRLADAVVDLLRNADLSRLRACPVAEGGCGFRFRDRSPNHSRRGCSMEGCGAHVKSRRMTERRRSRR
jgi:predicted RNA-binding Zn ribbon-like protein